MERGEIYNRDRARQIRDFSGLRFGNITPTDVDGFIEWKDRCHILIEAKFGDAKLPDGQRLALERAVDDWADKKPSVLFVATHNCPPDRDIDMASTIVTRFYYKHKWTMIPGMELREIVAKFLGRHGGYNGR